MNAQSADELHELAQQRGLRLEDLEQVACFGCGVAVPVGTAFRLGLAHWEDCDAEESQLRFKLRREVGG